MTANVTIKGEVVGEFVSTSGGWTTYISNDGKQRKVRNSQIDSPEGQEGKVSKGKGKAAKAKGKAKAAKAAKAKAEAGVRKCKEATFDMARYVKHKTPAGTHSYDNNDPVAQALRDKTLDEVYTVVARELKNSGEGDTIAANEQALRKRYGKLNAGMQRMNLGNKLRALTADAA